MKNLFFLSLEVVFEVLFVVQFFFEGRLVVLLGICIEKFDLELNFLFQVLFVLIFFSSYYLVCNDIDFVISCIY